MLGPEVVIEPLNGTTEGGAGMEMDADFSGAKAEDEFIKEALIAGAEAIQHSGVYELGEDDVGHLIDSLGCC
jgi:hypothetical protein